MEHNTKTEIIDVITEIFSGFEVVIQKTLPNKLIFVIFYNKDALKRVVKLLLSRAYSNLTIDVVNLYDIENKLHKGFLLTMEDKK